MSDLKDRILKIYPDATFNEGDTLQVNVDEKDWLQFATGLKEKLGFDVLTAVVGMDWKETIGVVYYLTCTSRDWEVLSVKVVCASRDNAYIHSVSGLWKVANFQEREVYDMFGIKFIGHPDMRRFFLRNDWVGHPLRKDYDANPALNPIRLEDEKNEDDTRTYSLDADGKVVETPGKVFEDDEYVVNIGPQHPSTHGVMRFRASLDGEVVRRSTSSPVTSTEASRSFRRVWAIRRYFISPTAWTICRPTRTAIVSASASRRRSASRCRAARR